MDKTGSLTKIGIFSQVLSEGTVGIVRKILYLGEAASIDCVLNPELYDYLQTHVNAQENPLPASQRIPLPEMQIDAVVCIGGDGSILRVARTRPDLPILSINKGRKGFMTEIDPNDVSSQIERFFEGTFTLEEHPRIDVFLGTQHLGTCINECVITSADLLKPIDFQLLVDGMLTSRSLADGIIVATAIGSTGHCLSSGGILVDPALDNIEIAWINAISLSIRPIILGSHREIRIRCETRINPVKLVFDGQITLVFDETPIEIDFRPSSETVKFFRASHFTSRWRRNFHPGLREQP